jgi:hypothetical protein
MAVTVPSTDGSYALQLQNQIANLQTLATLPAAYAAAELATRQMQLVNTLLQQQHLTAATILSTIAYNTAPQPVAFIQAQINAVNTLLASVNNTASAAGQSDLLAQLDNLQRAMVSLLMERGWMTAQTILSTMTYLT